MSEINEKLSKGQPLSGYQIKMLFESNRFTEYELDQYLSIFDPEELEGIQKIPEGIYTNNDIEATEKYLVWIPNLESELLSYFRVNPQRLYDMQPRAFEELVASIFRNNGFIVELTPETRDGGFDIIAVENSALTGHNMYLIECKRYARDRHVGIGVVQRLLGVVIQHQATKGIIVTTSYFSADAQRAAEHSKHSMSLRDYEAIVEWLNALVPR